MTQAPLRHYLDVARRNALILLLFPIVALAGAAALTATQDRVYHADMKIFVGQTGGGLQPVIGTQPLTQTMTNLLQSDVVMRGAIQRLDIDATPKDIAKRLKVTTTPDSSVLEVGLDWTDRREALALLDEISSIFSARVRDKLGLSSSEAPLNTQSSKVLFFATVFDPPHLKPDPVSPTPVKNFAFGGILGLLLGIVAVALREGLDDRIRGRGEAEAALNAPVIGALPRGAHKHPLTALRSRDRDPRGIAEAVRMLRANMRFSRAGVGGPTVLVTSSHEGEGKTTVTACVALALAVGGKRVVCIDADMRRPKLHELLGVSGDGVGLVDVVQGRARIEDALLEVDLARRVSTNGRNGAVGDILSESGSFRLVPAGAPTMDDLSLEADVIRGIVDQLAADADYIIFDAPPLLTSGDAFPVAQQMDNVIVAVRQGHTTKAGAESVRETLRGLGARRVSVVLTDTGAHETYGDRAG
jgi:succinoglycan biosynthesis transport protein ExoP